jgi:hypothetical protein
LLLYDWLHLHHEDFQGNTVNFMQLIKNAWYIEQKKDAEALATKLGFTKSR